MRLTLTPTLTLTRSEQLADGVRLWQEQLNAGEFEGGREEAGQVRARRRRVACEDTREAECLQARLR